MSTATLNRPTNPNTASTRSSDEAEIRRLISAWSRALEAKDLKGLTANYAPDALLFDVKPPHRVQGPAAIRKVWADCLPYFPKSFKSEHHDIQLTVGEDVAVWHGLHRMTPIDPPDHRCGQSWVRVTACYRKVEGKWLIIHEHVSFPFDCATGMIAPVVDPNAA